MNVELLVLDVAGTTVAASDDVGRVFREALDVFGLCVSAVDIAAVRGRSKKEMIREFAGPVDSGRIYREFRNRLVESSKSWQPVPGVQETIEWFKTQGVKVALTTGFDRVVLDALLENLGWADDLLDATVSSDDVQRGRPAPDLILRAMERCNVSDPLKVVVVGDTKADLESAHAAGVGFSIAVLSGAHGSAELSRHPHAAILDSVAELPAWFEAQTEEAR